jgi:predicted ester cyclase
MSEENKAIVRRMIDELLNGQGNLDVADELFAPYYVGHNPASPVDTRGPEGVKVFASMFRSAFPDVHFSVEDQVAEGDKVVTRWRGSGTHQGDLFGIAPTGKGASFVGITINRIEGGKVAEEWQIFDALGMMQQLGAIPSPGEAQA